MIHLEGYHDFLLNFESMYLKQFFTNYILRKIKEIFYVTAETQRRRKMRTLKIFIEKIFYVAQNIQELSCKVASCVDGFHHSSNASSVSANQLTFFCWCYNHEKIKKGSERALGGRGGEKGKRLMEGKLNFSCVLSLCCCRLEYTESGGKSRFFINLWTTNPILLLVVSLVTKI